MAKIPRILRIRSNFIALDLAQCLLYFFLTLATMEEQVILVDKQDNPIGLMPKLEAHQKALLHRAFSVFILNTKGELMLLIRIEQTWLKNLTTIIFLFLIM